jgi:hypothetical protein
VRYTEVRKWLPDYHAYIVTIDLSGRMMGFRGGQGEDCDIKGTYAPYDQNFIDFEPLILRNPRVRFTMTTNHALASTTFSKPRWITLKTRTFPTTSWGQIAIRSYLACCSLLDCLFRLRLYGSWLGHESILQSLQREYVWPQSNRNGRAAASLIGEESK